MSDSRIRLAVVGLGFGGLFVPVYRDHPDVAEVIPFDLDDRRLAATCEQHGVTSRFSSFEEIVDSREIDAVHLATPIPMHAQQALELMYAGKHCACAVPMATSLADLEALVQAQQETNSNYMMMETAAFTGAFLYVQQLIETGELGRIQFMRGAHVQDLEGLPEYWKGLPPMHYVTHVVGPLLAAAKTHATTVRCLGSGSMRPELQEVYDNPYPVETAIFRLADTPAAAEVTRTMFEVAVNYNETFSIYGDRLSFEWPQVHGEAPVIHRIGPLSPDAVRDTSWERIDVPDFAERLPAELARFLREPLSVDTPNGPVELTAPSGGSHPHLVHEFVSSIVEGRHSNPDAVVSAQWTAAGICAHDSAMRDGEAVDVPSFLGAA
jgi:predicted dehydrogenase